MNRIATLALVLALSACFKASPSVGNCAVDGDCGAGSTCNQTLHVCASACDHVCGSGELCVNGICSRQGPSIGLVTVTDNPAASTNGFYPRADGVSVPVTVVVDFGSKVAAGDANLVINGASLAAMSKSVAGSVKTFVFQVPTTVQAQGKETPVTFKVTATDGIDTKETTPLASLKIDDAPPAVTAVAAIGGVAVGGAQWFQQSAAGDIEIQADIVDNGSGVDVGSLQLLTAGTQRLDHGTPAVVSGNRYAFKVARVVAGVIAAGDEKLLTFDVKAADHLGHSPTTLARGKVGIDGKAPVISGVTVDYPAAGTGCDTSAAVTCGHDGAHFWRRGDAADGSDTGDITFTASDNGSGLAAASATCAIAGSSKGCTVGAGLKITPNFTDATLTAPDATTGGGTASITVGIKDAVGNVADPATPAAQTTVAVSRMRWARTLSAAPTVVGTLSGAPIVTSKPVDQIIVAGNGNTATDPIVALKPNGGVLWTGGKAQGITSVTNNMAYDPTDSTDINHPSPMLYAVDSTALHAMHISYPAAGAPSADPLGTSGNSFHSYDCGLTAGVGSPAIASGGSTPRILVSDDGSRNVSPSLTTFGPGTSGKTCAGNNPTASIQASSIGPPTIGPGGIAYLGYDNSGNDPTDIGLVSAQISSNTIAATTHKLGVGPFIDGVLSSVAIANGYYFGYSVAKTYHNFNPAFQPQWVTPPLTGATNVALAIPLVVAKGLALGATKNPGKLYAFDKTTGSQKWVYPATGSLNSISPVATGADGVIYFSDGTGEFVALAPPAGSVTTPTPAWTFKGSSPAVLTTVGSEPTISNSGVVYFTANGSASFVYALITDAASTLPPAAEWPRTGYDNCNSSNSTFVCQ